MANYMGKLEKKFSSGMYVSGLFAGQAILVVAPSSHPQAPLPTYRQYHEYILIYSLDCNGCDGLRQTFCFSENHMMCSKFEDFDTMKAL